MYYHKVKILVAKGSSAIRVGESIQLSSIPGVSPSRLHPSICLNSNRSAWPVVYPESLESSLAAWNSLEWMSPRQDALITVDDSKAQFKLRPNVGSHATSKFVSILSPWWESTLVSELSKRTENWAPLIVQVQGVVERIHRNLRLATLVVSGYVKFYFIPCITMCNTNQSMHIQKMNPSWRYYVLYREIQIFIFADRPTLIPALKYSCQCVISQILGRKVLR